jgi:hypothetical protein
VPAVPFPNSEICRKSVFMLSHGSARSASATSAVLQLYLRDFPDQLIIGRHAAFDERFALVSPLQAFFSTTPTEPNSRGGQGVRAPRRAGRV